MKPEIIAPALVFATNNQHKLEEVQALTGNKFQIKTMHDIGCFDDIPETGVTFRENASQKSHYLYDRFDVDCFADDSGLEVDALDGAPGVFSARYSGSRDMEKNLALVLKNMDGITNRRARFRCVISLILKGQEYFFEGTIEGNLTSSMSGAGGFGYDPIFIPEGSDRTFAEMSAGEKNGMSHRGQAIQKMVKFLLENAGQASN